MSLKIVVSGERCDGKSMLAKKVYETLLVAGYSVSVEEENMPKYPHEIIYNSKTRPIDKYDNDGREVSIFVENKCSVPLKDR